MIFWIMLIWVVLIGAFVKPNTSSPIKVNDNGTYSENIKIGYALLMWSVPLFFICMCTDFGDKASYLAHFSGSPLEFDKLESFISKWEKSRFFYGLQGIVKILFIKDATVWFSLIAIVQAICISRTLRKYSVNYAMSMFIFTASTLMMSWMCNGIRQFIVVAVLFACTQWIIDGKWIRYFILTFIFVGAVPLAKLLGIQSVPMVLGGFHQSALIMFPLFFAIRGKAFNKRLWVLLGITVILLLLNGFGGLISYTSYDSDMLEEGYQAGSNPLRLLVSLVPVVMVLIKYRKIKETERQPIVDLCINASVATAVLYAISTVTNGMLIGRLPIYTEMYSLILLPWLIENIYVEDKKYIKTGLYVAYTIYFYYQVNIAWASAPYRSSILGIN